jgi:hypothetical protein
MTVLGRLPGTCSHVRQKDHAEGLVEGPPRDPSGERNCAGTVAKIHRITRSPRIRTLCIVGKSLTACRNASIVTTFPLRAPGSTAKLFKYPPRNRWNKPRSTFCQKWDVLSGVVSTRADTKNNRRILPRSAPPARAAPVVRWNRANLTERVILKTPTPVAGCARRNQTRQEGFNFEVVCPARPSRSAHILGEVAVCSSPTCGLPHHKY